MKHLLILTLWSLPFCSHAQDTLAPRTLDEVIVSVNKWEQKLNEVPNKVTRMGQVQILRNNPQTAADLLGQSGTVFIQKSQLGGGSPMIRGFATNRVLLVLDGVRLNNAIYRSGNLQNVISIDPLGIAEAEVIFGPGSLIYGSDAIGGVMDFHTLPARLSATGKTFFSGSAQTRYASANQERTLHADLNVGGKRWSFLTSATFSKFGDLRMGKQGGDDSYLRPEFIERINNTDSIIRNADPRRQRFSGYEQLNLLQKLRFRPTENIDLYYTFHYARTGTAPRYDRLIQYRQGRLRFAEWNYGPMILNMHQLQLLHSRRNTMYDDLRFTAALQDYTESRIDRPFRSNNRTIQEERVQALVFNADATRHLGRGQLFYGAEWVHNRVGSTGLRSDIRNGQSIATASRYPDASTWSTGGFYASYKLNPDPRLTLTGGLRYSINQVQASFDTGFVRFPYREARLQKNALTGNLGLVFRPREGWQINAVGSSGYRMPNIDDLGKLFENAPGLVNVPNPSLKPEYAWNLETGLVHHKANRYRIELNLFYTWLDDAITRRPFTFNGQDSILFEGTRSRVEALQNVARATVYGIQASAEIFFARNLSAQTHANFTRGRETDDRNDVQVPLRHAAPFFGSTFVRYRKQPWFIELGAHYNSAVRAADLPPSEQAKPEIYAKDAEGRPWSPGWYTLHLKGSWQLKKHLLLTAGWENITNRRYRPYSSGIVAAGSNLIISLRASW